MSITDKMGALPQSSLKDEDNKDTIAHTSAKEQQRGKTLRHCPL